MEINQRKYQGIGQRQNSTIQLPAADAEDFDFLLTNVQRCRKGRDNSADRMGTEQGGAADDNIAAAGKRITDGFIGPAAHDQGVPHGDGFEMCSVLGELPGDGILEADDPMSGQSGDDDQFHASFFHQALLVGIREKTWPTQGKKYQLGRPPSPDQAAPRTVDWGRGRELPGCRNSIRE